MENKMKPIDTFDGKNAFLSNFYHSPIRYEGLEYPTVEHCYQALKTLDETERLNIRNNKSPGQAKRLGRKVVLRKDWENIKLRVMFELLIQKFSSPELLELLLNTGDAELIEGNYWRDHFWGICNGVGENHLGKLLMKIRKEFRENCK